MEKFDLDAYEALPDLTSDYVLNQVDDLLIYRHYLGPFQLGRPIKSPFRRDSNPSFSITVNPNWLKLMWKDFGTGEVGDCFKLISKLFNLSYPEAIHRVACDFGLIKGCRVVTKKQIEEARAFKEAFLEREFVIDVDPRPMNQTELAYWAQYNISKEDLKANSIYALKSLWINKKFIYLKPGLQFAYHFPAIDKFKIYSPQEKEWKWFGNVSAFQMEGVEKLVSSVYEPVIITKSRKDRIILSKLYPNVCSSQNEAETAIPKEMDKKFESMYPSKYCWFDSDEPGKTANRKLNYRGYKWINVPNQYYDTLGLKDPGDIIKHFGWEEGSKILNKEINRKLLV